MKKLIFISFLFIFFNQYSIASTIEKIEIERENCLSKNYHTDYTMAKCNYEAIEKCDIQINKLLKKIKRNIDKNNQHSLSASQSKWDEFINQDNFLLENLLENDKYFERYLISSQIKYQNKKHRLEELLILYSSIKD